jgi:hypothetical protein
MGDGVECKIEVSDPSALFRKLKRLGDKSVAQALLPVLEEEASTLRAAADGAAPHESGDLVASSFADAGLTRAGNAAATVGYAVDYAAAEHEGFHGGDKVPRSYNPWLQRTANAFSKGFGERMGEAIEAAVSEALG